MIDPTPAYRSAQAHTSSPLERTVLLYEGAIRFATLHLVALERNEREAAHQASLRAQEIVGLLQETLDTNSGPIADQLDRLYGFTLRRLAIGNISQDPRPTRQAMRILGELLQAWRALAASAPVTTLAETTAPALAASASRSYTGPNGLEAMSW